MNELIEARLKGNEMIVAPKAEKAPVIDMMQALKRSLAAKQNDKRQNRVQFEGHRQRRKAS